MIIKKFVGKTEQEAVEAAKKELGDGVVIMNVKNVKRKGLMSLFGAKLVEVTVALEEERETIVKARKEPVAAVKEDSASRDKKISLTPKSVSTDNIEKKLDTLQTLLESQIKTTQTKQEEAVAEKSQPVKQQLPEEQTDKTQETAKPEENPEQEKFIRLLYNTMIDNEVDQRYANQIMDEIDRNMKPNIPIDYILANVYQRLILKFGKTEGITQSENKPKVVAFVGPTGVGKTTTIAKVASSFSVDEKKKIALVTSDTYRIAAAEQLRTYANILEVPFRVIYTEEELKQAIEAFREYDYIFLDTTGHSHRNEELFLKMKNLLNAIDEVAERDTFLVLSATTKYADLLKIAQNYKEITDFKLIFTKLDETSTVGNLLNMKLSTDSPIAYVTDGQNVPDDIEKFNPQKMVKQLLGGH